MTLGWAARHNPGHLIKGKFAERETVMRAILELALPEETALVLP
jgi:hypothetical protein